MKTPIKSLIVVALGAAVVGAVVLKKSKSAADTPSAASAAATVAAASDSTKASPVSTAKLPKMVDLGAGKCIPCKMMKPILDDLKANYADRFTTVFIDVWENPDEGKKYGIEIIPTQIFYDAEGKELFRHTGFFGKEDILAKWKELGVDAAGKPSVGIVRETPLAADTRPRESVCFMCDENVNPKTKTVVKGQSEQRVLCGPHCYFIYFSSIVGADPKAEEAKVSVTDWGSGNLVAAAGATYLYGMDSKGRPTIKAFADKDAATKEQQASSGNVVSWDVLQSKELATRCAFCDRAVYPEDACGVKFGTTHGYGCCTHCSMGVAARLKQDIEVEAKDGLTGELIRVKTLNGQIASLEPASAVAWFGQKKDGEGKWVSAGCFKQGFFVNTANLQKWLDARPAMTGRQISIAQALADKMKLSPEQIAKACKLGECK
ncbi:MAG: thioredoxin fold domain-containing protein [Verrucomicrobia bacterium]|jgi:thioredoxin 1|nr:thioredoxin fold domain-containing protein [Verrucomicrobiota bacterium]